jgi:hypothetical protein
MGPDQCFGSDISRRVKVIPLTIISVATGSSRIPNIPEEASLSGSSETSGVAVGEGEHGLDVSLIELTGNTFNPNLEDPSLSCRRV